MIRIAPRIWRSGAATDSRFRAAPSRRDRISARPGSMGPSVPASTTRIAASVWPGVADHGLAQAAAKYPIARMAARTVATRYAVVLFAIRSEETRLIATEI